MKAKGSCLNVVIQLSSLNKKVVQLMLLRLHFTCRLLEILLAVRAIVRKLQVLTSTVGQAQQSRATENGGLPNKSPPGL